ncbi:alcohol dehydrogenase, putative [Phytophthora infestans T30-4]|uniref:Alcohol dehydrogenase, putative n=1 Tax=Phytophthora infestans (strain T30-4) TaxID=403677 RepID=D0NWU6_PHYIT|nr:alcohol dehydrogenase, putative [Phytophthora infestans T30-4]EEY67533.1 alcohol dehydrogenase, putative [Phytophthora infestans T30-4]|eukprot:XP_002896392.1 alcohol dehydrogenase, putative [Phytophthora infestans T30-4]
MSTAFGPRTINAYAAFQAGASLKPWQYQSRPLGEEDVEVKISHCGVCGGDIHALKSPSAPFPCVVGHEIVGEVTQTGSAVKNLFLGDRVGVGFNAWACLNKDQTRPCRECASGNDAYCSRAVFTSNAKYEDGHQSFGGFADYIRVSSNYAFCRVGWKEADRVPHCAHRVARSDTPTRHMPSRVTNKLNFACGQRLGEHIRNHDRGRTVHNLDCFALHLLANPVIAGGSM